MSDFTRPSVPAMDALLGTTIPCLDHGFIRVIDYMGDDAAVVQAARVSYGSGTRQVREDRALIRYLIRHRHTSPLEMCEIKLHVKLPIFLARQWIRHRTASVNEISGRYSILESEFYTPPTDFLARQAVNNKQGRAEQIPETDAQTIQEQLRQSAARDANLYTSLMADHDLARELARLSLPVSTYTSWYWKCDLHNLLHFMGLRLHPHAQKEFQVYAQVIVDILKAWVPLTWEAFVDYQKEAHTFSRQEMEALRKALAGIDPLPFLEGVSAREATDFMHALGLEGGSKTP